MRTYLLVELEELAQLVPIQQVGGLTQTGLNVVLEVIHTLLGTCSSGANTIEETTSVRLFM
jgi:hypothetical protein